MKISEDFLQTELSHVPYLIPAGQSAALRRHPLVLNESALSLWNQLREIPDLSDLSAEELVNRLVEKLKSEEPDAPGEEELKSDMEGFLNTLLFYGALKDEKGSAAPPDSYYSIGGVVMKIEGKPGLLSEELNAFRVDETEPDLTVSFEEELLIRDPELNIEPIKEGFLFSFPNSDRLDQIRLSSDGKEARIRLCAIEDETSCAEIFYALRTLFSYIAQDRNQFLLHSVSLLYRGRAYLFSAPSGTGKSTHAALWKKLWPKEVEDINGDINLLSLNKDSSCTVEGIPWNGTSGIYRNGSFPLGGIVFLRQEPENAVHVWSKDKQALSLTQRLISPFWTRELLAKNIAFANALVQKIPVWHLSCTKEEEAAVLMRREIDRSIDSE
ncbi:MAG: hypothetical protein IJT05_05740 [Lachnospiraceae bacterium]|nr:hypothetical protein [Lachnospiraceae bacterium]